MKCDIVLDANELHLHLELFCFGKENIMWEHFWHILEHTMEHSISIVPFLFLTYLVMEYIEHCAGEQVQHVIEKAGPFGPVLGSVAGAVPQCGFSTAAANFYTGRVITLGTLMAIFLSTSDEMLPILISNQVEVGTIFKLLGIKVIIGMVAGLAIDAILRGKKWKAKASVEEHVCAHAHEHHHGEHEVHAHENHHGDHARGEHHHHEVHHNERDEHYHHEEHGGHDSHDHHDADAHNHDEHHEEGYEHSHEAHEHHHEDHDDHLTSYERAHGHCHDHDHAHTRIHELCEQENCHCENGVFMSAVIHTVHIFLYILLITFALNLIIEGVGEEKLGELLLNRPVLGQLVAAVVGLIPNCASSVVITELFLSGALGLGSMMAGLLVNAGVGVLVLFRVNRSNMKENFKIVGLLYVIGVVAGILLDLLPIAV